MWILTTAASIKVWRQVSVTKVLGNLVTQYKAKDRLEYGIEEIKHTKTS